MVTLAIHLSHTISQDLCPQSQSRAYLTSLPGERGPSMARLPTCSWALLSTLHKGTSLGRGVTHTSPWDLTLRADLPST